MEFKNVLYELDCGVAKIMLNRPDSLNPLSLQTVKELRAAIVLARDDPQARAIVITGAGRAFCSGGDVKAMQSGHSVTDAKERLQLDGREIVLALAVLEKPVIAMVNGAAVGAGVGLALACDIVIAAEEAKFSFPFVRFGLVPDLGVAQALPRLIGMQKAKLLIFSGRTISAVEAERLGMVTQVVPVEDLETTVMGLARQLAKGPTKAIGMSKVMIQAAFAGVLPEAIDLEAMAQAVCAGTEDFLEGIGAFREKRQPEFKGR